MGLQFSANLSLLYPEYPLLERVEQAAGSGFFQALEVQFPYEHSVKDWHNALAPHALPLVLFNLPAGDWAAGERGIACLPDRCEEFLAGVSQALDYAENLGTLKLNCIAGVLPTSVDTVEAQKTLIDNLCRAAKMLHKAGRQLLIEPINDSDVARFFVSRAEHALDIIQTVRQRTGLDNVHLQYDIYHAARMLGLGESTSSSGSHAALAHHWQRYLPWAQHIQIADCPGRHEPGTGLIDFRAFFKYLLQSAYSGWVGCEYLPLTTEQDREATAKGMDWVQALGV